MLGSTFDSGIGLTTQPNRVASGVAAAPAATVTGQASVIVTAAGKVTPSLTDTTGSARVIATAGGIVQPTTATTTGTAGVIVKSTGVVSPPLPALTAVASLFQENINREFAIPGRGNRLALKH